MTKVNKITDLRREVKERLEKKNITDLTEMKLKEIDISQKRGSKAISNSLNTMGIKIGKTLINPILDSEVSTNTKFKEIEDIVNVGDIRISIEEIDAMDNETDEIIRLLKSVAKNKANGDKFIKVTVSDDKEEVFAYSWLNFDAKASNEGLYHFRTRGAKSYPITGLRKIIGTVYLANAMNKYYKKNTEMAERTILKYIQHTGIYKNKEQFEDFQEIADSLGFRKVVRNNIYLEDFDYDDEKILSTGKLLHLFWFKNKEFFTVANIYGTAEKYNNLGNTKDAELIAFFANFLIELNREEEEEIKAIRKLSSDYATSFQTKKNIPQVILDKMEATLFLNHFGYVEFDESVDLEKIEQIEEEWVEINKKINLPIAKDHSLRFRRLGNHKAGGLYFPGVNAVCVDLGSPSSMIHEVLHMIDYQNHKDTLSSQYDFRGIIDMYRDVTNELVEKLDNTDAFKVKWKGSSKTNKVYFHSSKEIFARCGEIYIKQILKIDSSLVKGDTHNILYPKDKDLLSLIEKYYSNVIKIASDKAIKDDKNTYFAPLEEEKLSKEAVASILKENQLSMF